MTSTILFRSAAPSVDIDRKIDMLPVCKFVLTTTISTGSAKKSAVATKSTIVQIADANENRLRLLRGRAAHWNMTEVDRSSSSSSSSSSGIDSPACFFGIDKQLSDGRAAVWRRTETA